VEVRNRAGKGERWIARRQAGIVAEEKEKRRVAVVIQR